MQGRMQGQPLANLFLFRNEHYVFVTLHARETRAGGTLAHVQAAVDVENLAGDVAGFIAGEEDDGGGDVAIRAETTERDHGLHFVFYFLRERISHGRSDEAGGDRVHRDTARSDFNGDGAREADQARFRCDVIRLAGVARLGDYGSDVDD